ncbi:MAG: T9SS type A sorting domain-containing protein [Flavobacteriales bacterium]|nr:T9SS type A sorting domain-containing protein [Flavobacteriales bacterium]
MNIIEKRPILLHLGMVFLRILLFLLLPILCLAQPATLMTWNLLNFYETSSDRVPYYRTVIDSMQPELLVVQEMQGQAAATYFRQEVIHGTMAMAQFIPGPDSDNALFYDSVVFEIMAVQVISTTLRDIAWYTLRHRSSTDTLHVFSVHLKSSTGTANEQQRLSEVNNLRNVTDALPQGSYFIVCGDFNFYGSTEPAYQRLLAQDGNTGYFIDQIGTSGLWNSESYAIRHTQSPRVRSFGGGASGGLDDRFDLILFSHSFGPSGRIQYMYGTSWAVGNDGNHYNDSINALPNTSVSQTMANALHYASDHLPVVTSFNFINPSGIEEHSSGSPLKVQPNPSNGIFNLHQSSGKTIDIYTVCNAFGEMLLSVRAMNTNENTIDLTSYPSGMYFLRVIINGKSHSVPLVKY